MNGKGGGGERRSDRWERERERGTGTEVETRGRTPGGNRDGSGDGNESSSGHGNGDEDGNGIRNKDRVGEGGREAKNRKKPHKSWRRHVGNGGGMNRNGKIRRQGGVDLVAANPDNLEDDKEEGGGGGRQGIQRLSKNCTSRASVSPLLRLIRVFRQKYPRSSLGRIHASDIE